MFLLFYHRTVSEICNTGERMRECELCGTKKLNGMRFAKRAACFQCIDKVLEFCITAGMKLGEGDGFEPPTL